MIYIEWKQSTGDCAAALPNVSDLVLQQFRTTHTLSPEGMYYWTLCRRPRRIRRNSQYVSKMTRTAPKDPGKVAPCFCGGSGKHNSKSDIPLFEDHRRAYLIAFVGLPEQSRPIGFPVWHHHALLSSGRE